MSLAQGRRPGAGAWHGCIRAAVATRVRAASSQCHEDSVVAVALADCVGTVGRAGWLTARWDHACRRAAGPWPFEADGREALRGKRPYEGCSKYEPRNGADIAMASASSSVSAACGCRVISTGPLMR